MNRAWLLLGLLIPGWLAAQENPPQPPADESSLRQAAESYVQAFNAHDAQAVAALWSPEAVYLNRLTGEKVVGRDKIAAQFVELFKAQPQLKLDVSVASLQLLSPNVAVEHGDAKFLAPQGEPETIAYTAVYVKRDGKWLLDRVTDQAPERQVSHYEQLKPLEWMVGKWVDQDQQVRIETDCHWSKNRNFLVRSFTVAAGDKLQMAGMQIIGWDGASKSIRSWTFDSDGGFAEATWSRQKNDWHVHNKGVLADGRKATMVNVIKPISENSFTWQTIERTVAGEVLPNIAEVEIVRQ